MDTDYGRDPALALRADSLFGVSAYRLRSGVKEEVMGERCMVNHELEQGLFFTLLDQHKEAEAILRRAVSYLKSAMRESTWSEAEDFVDEADAFLARINSAPNVLKPGEEPF